MEGVTYIEATLEDYKIAYSLARQVMGESFTELKKPQRTLLTQVEALIEEKGALSQPLQNASGCKDAGQRSRTAGGSRGPETPAEVTRREIREHTGLTDFRLREMLAELVSLEYLATMDGSQGRTFRYRLADRGIRPEKIVVGLTAPEELAKKLQNNAETVVACV